MQEQIDAVKTICTKHVAVDFSQPSTIRGFIFVVCGFASLVAYFMKMDPMPIVVVGTTIAGALGVAISDKPKDS